MEKHQVKKILFRVKDIWHDIKNLLRQFIYSPTLFGDPYVLVDNTQVTLYTDQPDLFPGYKPVKALRGGELKQQVKVSFIATIYNSRSSVKNLIMSIMTQSRLPDEIVIVDAGSSDGTTELLLTYSSQSQIPMKVIIEPGVNVSGGRNIAIKNARFPIIASADFGCRVKPEWLENILKPFEMDPEIEVVAGWYEAVDLKGQLVQRQGWVALQNVNPQTFLPSSRSLAFSKATWEKVGGYPEWLTLTGEDTYFDCELKRNTKSWAFVPEAIVEWDAPPTLRAYWKKAYKWSIGDGETGILAHTYRWVFLRIIAGLIGPVILLTCILLFVRFPSFKLGLTAILWMILWIGVLYAQVRKTHSTFTDFLWESCVSYAQVLGFTVGMIRRPIVSRRRLGSLRGIEIILSGTPTDIPGGAARCFQIASELLLHQYMVVFISNRLNPESNELNILIRHPNLLTKRLGNFSLAKFIREYGEFINQKTKGVLVEFPLPDFLPLIEELHKLKFRIVYDLLGDWDTSLRLNSYNKKTEQKIIEISNNLIATTESLVKRLESTSGRPVIYLPNAVNSFLFNFNRTYPRPDDLPPEKWCVIYIGALQGDWFDWQLLIKIAKRYPEANVVVIGDYQGQCPEELPNLYFLGLKAQRDLPAYLYYSSVAIIPWKVTPITQATNPLKAYEYIAMGKPVVAPNLQTLSGLPGVYFAQDDEDFIAKVAELRGQSIPPEVITRFVELNDWKARVNQLLELLQ